MPGSLGMQAGSAQREIHRPTEDVNCCDTLNASAEAIKLKKSIIFIVMKYPSRYKFCRLREFVEIFL